MAAQRRAKLGFGGKGGKAARAGVPQWTEPTAARIRYLTKCPPTPTIYEKLPN